MMMMMMGVAQASSASIPDSITLGNAIVYYSEGLATTASGIIAKTDWQPLGVMDGSLDFSVTSEKLPITSGFPAQTVVEFITKSETKLTGKMLELTFNNFLLSLGRNNTDATYTYKSGITGSTATGTTASLMKLTTGHGFLKGHVAEVTIGADKYYRQVKSVTTTDVILYSPLPSVPPNLSTVKALDSSQIKGGQLSASRYYSFKISKTMSDGTVTDIYIYKAQNTGSLQLGFADNGQATPLTLPLDVTALSDSTIDGGATYLKVDTYPAVPSFG